MAVKFVRVALNKEELELLIEVHINNPKLHRKFRRALLTNEWDETPNDSRQVNNVLVSKEQAYIKWSSDPTICTQQEIQLAMDYRYLKDLMTEQEREDYEAYLNTTYGDL